MAIRGRPAEEEGPAGLRTTEANHTLAPVDGSSPAEVDRITGEGASTAAGEEEATESISRLYICR